MRFSPTLIATASLILSFAPAAGAQPSPTATARELAIQGIDAVEKGDCDTGRPLLERAEKLHHAVVHLQYLARCKVQEGKLVEATELWRRITTEGVPPGATPAVHAAYDEAERELPKMLPRLAKTSLVLAAKYPDLVVQLDGNTLPKEMVEAPQVLDPGDHEIVANAPGYATFTHRWTLSEGETEDVTIRLTPGESDAGAAGGAGDRGAEGKSNVLPTVGWITVVVGGAALVGGTITWLSRNSRRDNLREKCGAGDPDICGDAGDDITEPQFNSEKSTVEDLTLATNILMIAGVAAAATGVTLIVIGGSGSEADHATTSVSFSPAPSGGALWLHGRF